MVQQYNCNQSTYDFSIYLFIYIRPTVVRHVSAYARLHYVRTCVSLTTVATMDRQSTEDALRRRRERERERRARETPEQRGARLSQQRERRARETPA